MSQTFHVVRCAGCGQFQNHIVKQASNSKWTCKLCSSKQSLSQVFATGPATDCRKVVQQLNLGQGAIQETIKAVKAVKIAQTDREHDEESVYEEEQHRESENHPSTLISDSNSTTFYRVVPKERSRWAKYPKGD